MKRKLIAFSMTMALLLSVFSAASVGAHTIAIESLQQPPGLPVRDWFGAQTDTSGEGIVQRNATQQGEFIYNDAGKDQRVVNVTPAQATDKITREVDLDWFGVTADANNVYFITKVDLYRGIQNDPSIELMITVDTNHTNGSGTLQLPLGTTAYSTTNVPADAAWEFAVNTSFRPGNNLSNGVVNGTTKIWTNASTSSTCGTANCPSQLVSSAVPAGSFAEISIPWNKIGNKPTGANFLRFTASIMYSPSTAGNQATRLVPPDGYNSPIVDFLGAEKNATDTLATLVSGTLKQESVFDVHFDTNGANPTYEPYAPLMVSEFQPNPLGDDSPGPGNTTTHDSEWIEIYNPNTFPISNLSDYKIGNAAKRGSGEGMFKFKSSAAAIPAGGVIVVAKFKAKFLEGHPGYAGTVYDIQSDLTKYSAWASGSTISLANGPSTGVGSSGTYEEQVLLLDAKDGIVDMATYGNPPSPYPGHTPISVVDIAEGVSFERCPASLDTNNNSTDFVTHGTVAAETPGVACVGRPGVDMQIAKSGPTTVKPGQTARFTISYSNIGNTADTVNTVTITDSLPSGLTFIPSAGNAVPEPTSVNGSTLTWSLPAPPPGGAESTIILTATVGAGLGPNVQLVNQAGITSPNEPAGVRANNFAAWPVTTQGPADLSVSSNLAGSVPPGGQFTFNITYQNTGQDDATDVVVSDTLPPGVTIVSQDAPGATFQGGTSGTVSWNVGTLPANTSGTIQVVAKVSSAAQIGATLSNTVTISSSGSDPTPANNTETKTFKVGFRKLYLPLVRR